MEAVGFYIQRDARYTQCGRHNPLQLRGSCDDLGVADVAMLLNLGLLPERRRVRINWFRNRDTDKDFSMSLMFSLHPLSDY